MNENIFDVQEEPHPCSNVRYKHIRFDNGYGLTLCIQLSKLEFKRPTFNNLNVYKIDPVETLTRINVGWAVCVPADIYKRKDGNKIACSRLLYDVHCYLSPDEKVTSKYVLLRALLLLYHSNWDFPLLHSDTLRKHIDYLIVEING